MQVPLGKSVDHAARGQAVSSDYAGTYTHSELTPNQTEKQLKQP